MRALIEEERFDIFIKPAEGLKKTTGKVIKRPTDYCNLSFTEDFPMMCAELVDIVSEWRCYIRHGEILTIKHYGGDPLTVPRRSFVEAALASGFSELMGVEDPFPQLSAAKPGSERFRFHFSAEPENGGQI